MQLGRTRTRFRTTKWTLLGVLRNGSEAQRRQALDAICRDYWPPVYAFLRRSGCGRDEAGELAQAFFAEVVIGRRLLDGADQSKGRARSLICAALRNFRLDHARRNQARRARVVTVSGDDIEREEQLLRTAAEEPPQDAFDRRWALSVLDRALRRCEEYYREKGLSRNWEAFAARVLRPRTGHCEPVPPAQLAQELGFSSTADLAAAVQVVKRRLEILIHAEASVDSAGGDDPEAGYQRLFSLLS
jgi:RNA polymerase sigma-70 factor (ECF subfamily)